MVALKVRSFRMAWPMTSRESRHLSLRHLTRNDRGAILIHVAIGSIALLAFSALTFDYGVNLVSRRQAQNSADAAALAGAISLSYVNRTDFTLATNSAIAAANRNTIWGAAPDILQTDVTYPACPPGAPGVGGTCVKADVFRTSYGRASGSPLPSFFGSIVGAGDQGTRATATAQLLTGSGSADCIKPWGIPDKWQELRPGPAAWTNDSVFERYERANGPNPTPAVLNPADVYTPPTAGGPGTGFTLPQDHGRQIILYVGDPRDTIRPGLFYPIRINPDCNGGNCYRDYISGCYNGAVGPGTIRAPEPGAMRGPTRQGVEALIALDPGASWDPTLNGVGGIRGGCMYAGTCARSPRLVAIPVFDVDFFNYQIAQAGNNAINQQGGGGGRGGGGGNDYAGPPIALRITKVIGVFFEGYDGPGNNANLRARIMAYPTTSLTGPALTPSSMFASTVILVR